MFDYGLIIFYNSLKQTEVAKLNRLQYRAAKLCCNAFHLTSQSKLEADLGWESLSARADFLGLSLFHKIHIKQTRPLIRMCMPEIKYKNKNTRSNEIYEPFPQLGLKFSSSFFPYFTKLYNKLKPSLRCELDMANFKSRLKLLYKPKKLKHFSCGSKIGNSLLTRLRVGRSDLNLHKFTLNLTDTDLCSNCLTSNFLTRESVTHYLQDCNYYSEERRTLFDTVSQHIPNFTSFNKNKKEQILLYGINLHSDIFDVRNFKIAFAVQNFIIKSKRFSTQPPTSPPTHPTPSSNN